MTTGMSINIAWYFFLAGAGSGTYLVSLAFEAFGKPESGSVPSSRFHATATVVAAALVIAGSAFLYVDLGVPSMFMLVFKMLGTSVISFGAFSIGLFLGFCALRLLLQARARSRATRIAKAVCTGGAAIFAFTTSAYTGFFLFTMKSIPFWDTPLVVILFIASSLSSGAACLLGILVLGRFADKSPAIRAFCRADTVLLAIEAVVLAAFLCSRIMAGGSAAARAFDLVGGSAGGAFWVGIVLVGIVLPLALEQAAIRQRNDTSALLAAASSLAGGLILRCSIILI